jgi:hypothetical protein
MCSKKEKQTVEIVQYTEKHYYMTTSGIQILLTIICSSSKNSVDIMYHHLCDQQQVRIS